MAGESKSAAGVDQPHEVTPHAQRWCVPGRGKCRHKKTPAPRLVSQSPRPNCRRRLRPSREQNYVSPLPLLQR